MIRPFRMLVPDGSMETKVAQLLGEAGIQVSFGPRCYQGSLRPVELFCADSQVVKLRPWDAIWVVADGGADLAFVGDDLIVESGRAAEVVVLDRYALSRGDVGQTTVVVAVPIGSPIETPRQLTGEHVVVTEYPVLAAARMAEWGVAPQIKTCKGSLEAFHFVDIADAIVENIETGGSLAANGWKVIASILTSQLCLIVPTNAQKDERISGLIKQIRLLVSSVMLGRTQKLIKLNVSASNLEAVVSMLPSALRPTVTRLANGAAGEEWFAVESVIKAADVPSLLPKLSGSPDSLGRDVLIVNIEQAVP